MINVLIPIAGEGKSFQEAGYVFPKSLVEIKNRPMIEWVVSNLTLSAPHRFIFIIRSEDAAKFNLDSTLRIIAPGCEIIYVDQPTKGAAASALLALDLINNDEQLVIANGDQYIFADCQAIIDEYQERRLAGGIVTFNAAHPRWSYALLDENNLVCQTAEKRCISRNAIVGIYYFEKGSDFVTAAMEMIRNDENVNGQYYISLAYNQMVLKNKRIGTKNIEREAFISFGTPRDLVDFERSLGEFSAFEAAQRYITLFNEKNIVEISKLLDDDVVLYDPVVKRVSGKENVLKVYKDIFAKNVTISFLPQKIIVAAKHVSIEFTLHIPSGFITGVDMIDFSDTGKIKRLYAYFGETN